MPPQLDLLVAVLELAAFFLVTPEVIGRRWLEAAFHHMGRLPRGFERSGSAPTSALSRRAAPYSLWSFYASSLEWAPWGGRIVRG